MQECSNCGATVRDGAKFCTSCGTRLNDTTTQNQVNSWALPDTDPTVVVTAVSPPADEPELASPEPDTESSQGDEAESPATEPEPDTAPVESAASVFSWSWGSTASSTDVEGVEGDDGSSPPPIEADDAAIDVTFDPVDAAEAEVLADDPDTSDEPVAIPVPDEPEPVDDQSTAEAQDTVEDDSSTDESEDADDGGDATLAAWAGQWSEENGETVSTDAGEDIVVTPAVPDAESEDTTDEDPADRAERLLDELKLIIPSLRQPRALEEGANAEGNTGLLGSSIPPGLLEELHEDGGDQSFDGVREAIEQAQANPRDIDSMIKLAANADRLKLLLDDRDRLAGKLLDIRARLQPPADETS